MSKIVNTHCPALPAQPGLDASLMAVLVSDRDDGAGPYAVYEGIVPCSAIKEMGARRDEAAEWVALRGTKLRFRDAARHYPGIREQDYRA